MFPGTPAAVSYLFFSSPSRLPWELQYSHNEGQDQTTDQDDEYTTNIGDAQRIGILLAVIHNTLTTTTWREWEIEDRYIIMNLESYYSVS